MSDRMKNILSLLGIIAFFALIIFIAILGFKKNKSDTEEYYAPIAEEVPTPTMELEVSKNAVVDITTLLEEFAGDVERLLVCNNPNYISINTPGVDLSDIVSIRTALGKSRIALWQVYRADTELSTLPNKAEYLFVFDVITETKTYKLYVYTWSDYYNQNYVLTVSGYDIGEF